MNKLFLIKNSKVFQGERFLNTNKNYFEGFKLFAPVKGKMEKNISESISASITVTLKKDNNIIFSDTSTNCGLEIVLE